MWARGSQCVWSGHLAGTVHNRWNDSFQAWVSKLGFPSCNIKPRSSLSHCFAKRQRRPSWSHYFLSTHSSTLLNVCVLNGLPQGGRDCFTATAVRSSSDTMATTSPRKQSPDNTPTSFTPFDVAGRPPKNQMSPRTLNRTPCGPGPRSSLTYYFVY